MMMAPVASRVNVSGIRIAVPAAGPRPGSTPIAVPRRHPTRAKVRLGTVSADWRPVRSRERVSIAASDAEPSDRQGYFQPVVKDVEDAEAAENRAGHERQRRAHAEHDQQAADEQ